MYRKVDKEWKHKTVAWKYSSVTDIVAENLPKHKHEGKIFSKKKKNNNYYYIEPLKTSVSLVIVKAE